MRNTKPEAGSQATPLIFTLAAEYWAFLLERDETLRQEWQALCSKVAPLPPIKVSLYRFPDWVGFVRELMSELEQVLPPLPSQPDWWAQQDPLAPTVYNLQVQRYFTQLVHEFAVRWKVGEWVEQMIWLTLATARGEKLQKIAQTGVLALNLFVHSIMYPRPVGNPPIVRPPVYNPLLETRKEYKRRVIKQLAQEIDRYCKAVEQAYKQHGLPTLNDRRIGKLLDRKRKYRQRVYEQLYLRLIKGWSWEQIAAKIKEKRETVRWSTESTAKILRIPLSKTPKSV